MMADYEPQDEFEAWWPVGRKRWIDESASVYNFVRWAFCAGWQQRDAQLRRAALTPDSAGQTRPLRFIPRAAPNFMPAEPAPGRKDPGKRKKFAEAYGATPDQMIAPGLSRVPLGPPLGAADYDWRPLKEADLPASASLEHTETVYDPERVQYTGPVPTFVKDEDAEADEYYNG
jgi:hypothetical protein